MVVAVDPRRCSSMHRHAPPHRPRSCIHADRSLYIYLALSVYLSRSICMYVFISVPCGCGSICMRMRMSMRSTFQLSCVWEVERFRWTRICCLEMSTDCLLVFFVFSSLSFLLLFLSRIINCGVYRGYEDGPPYFSSPGLLQRYQRGSPITGRENLSRPPLCLSLFLSLNEKPTSLSSRTKCTCLYSRMYTKISSIRQVYMQMRASVRAR